MSDVSGIPYMGPMGQGNFFAPSFSYNPQVNPTAGYAGPAAYGQGILGQTLQDTQRSQQYSANLISSAAMAMPNSPGGAYMFSDTGGPAGGWGGNAFNQGAINNFMTGGGGYNFPSIPDYSSGGGFGGASPYQTTPNVFNTGASSFSSPGAGAIDWGGLFSAPRSDFSQSRSGLFGSDINPYAGLSNQPALNSSMATPQQQPIDYSSLFGRGVGGTGGAPQPSPYTSGIAPDETGGRTFGERFDALGGSAPMTDPYPGMTMPGGLNSPMTTPQPGASFSERFDALGGSAPMAEPGTRTYDLAPMFEAGGGGGFGAGGGDTRGTEDANAGAFAGNAFTYNPYSIGGAQDTTPASTLADQARGRLARLMDSERPVELAADPLKDPTAPAAAASAAPKYDENRRLDELEKYQRERDAFVANGGNPADFPALKSDFPAVPTERQIPQPGAAAATSPATNAYPGANPPRPPESVPAFPAARLAPNGKEPELFVVHHTGGRGSPESVVADWKANRPGVGSQYIMDRNGVIHDTANEYGHTATGHAITLEVPGSGVSNKQQGTSNRSIVGMEIVAEDEKDVTPAQRAALVQFANERYPNTPFYGHGEISLNRMNDEGIPGAQAVLASRPAPFNFDWSNAPIPDPSGKAERVPLPQERPAEAPGAVPLEQRPGVNQSQNITPPPAEIPDARVAGAGFNALDAAANAPAAPVKHSGLELARANIDTPIEKIAMERGGQKAVDQISSMAMGMTPRQLMQSYGGLFMSRAEPLFKSLGITRQDFEKAITMPQTKQDLKMRFGEGTFGPYPDYTGPEAALPGDTGGGAYPMPSTLHPDITDERGQLADVLSAGSKDSSVKGFEEFFNQPSTAPAEQSDGTGSTASNNWNVPKEGTPEWNKEVYEPYFGSMIMRRPENQTIGGASSYNDFRREAIDDRRNEQLSRDQLARLKATPSGQYLNVGPDTGTRAGPLSDDIGLGNLPMPRGGTADNMTRVRGIVGNSGVEEDNVVGPRKSAFDFDPGGYGEGGYGGAFQSAPTRDDLAAAASAPNNGFSRYSDEGYGTSTGRSPPVTLSPEHMRTMEEIESHQNPRLHDPGSSYKGLYQLSDSEFRKYGGTGSIFNAEQNTKAATAKMYAEGQRAQDILGRALTPVEQYMVHQQGLAGTLSHLAHPDQPAWKSWQQAASSSEAKAKEAIWGNLSNNQKAQFGNDVNNITSRDFINLWNTMYYQKMVESGLSPGGLSDLPR